MDLKILSLSLTLACVGLAIWVWRLREENSKLKAEVVELSGQLEEAVRRLSKHEKKPKALKKVIDILAAAGVPGLVLIIAMSISGFTGAAAITAALASLGGPAGMLGGMGLLLTIGIVIARYGVSDVTSALVRKLLETKSKSKLLSELDSLPRFVPERVRKEAKLFLEKT